MRQIAVSNLLLRSAIAANWCVLAVAVICVFEVPEQTEARAVRLACFAHGIERVASTSDPRTAQAAAAGDAIGKDPAGVAKGIGWVLLGSLPHNPSMQRTGGNSNLSFDGRCVAGR